MSDEERERLERKVGSGGKQWQYKSELVRRMIPRHSESTRLATAGVLSFFPVLTSMKECHDYTYPV